MDANLTPGTTVDYHILVGYPNTNRYIDRMRRALGFLVPLVSEFNVYRWAGRMLVDAAERRRKERLFGRFSNWTRYARVSGT